MPYLQICIIRDRSCRVPTLRFVICYMWAGGGCCLGSGVEGEGGIWVALLAGFTYMFDFVSLGWLCTGRHLEVP